MGFASEPDKVYLLLTSNLSFARVCGFIPKGEDEQYWFKYVPSLRKLEQFDQIMTDYGLWSKSKWNEVRQNIEKGVIKKENELVGDTTHYYAFSGFETLTFKNEKGKEKTSHSQKLPKVVIAIIKRNANIRGSLRMMALEPLSKRTISTFGAIKHLSLVFLCREYPWMLLPLPMHLHLMGKHFCLMLKAFLSICPRFSHG